MSNHFREIARSQLITLPGNLAGWLDGNDLAHFIGEVVEVLDTREIEAACRRGASAWASENRLVLGQLNTEAKSNEITAIPELLQVIDISGGIITIDAMGCQKNIAATIIQKPAG